MTDQSLIQLAYVSQRSERIHDDEIVDEIVLPAMLNNRKLNITGCLWFGPDRFFQILEGEPGLVDALYASIERDQRHDHVMLVKRDLIEKRSFSRFSMRAVGNEELAEVVDDVYTERVSGAQQNGHEQRLSEVVSRAIVALTAWPLSSV